MTNVTDDAGAGNTTTVTDAPLDPALGEVMRALDLAIVEWVDEEQYRPLTRLPDWFTGTVSWMSLPFLQHFVDEARRYLHDHLGGVLASDQFSTQSGDQELLLRARALKINGRLVLAIERLEGASDIRPTLRKARQQALDHEVLTNQARAIQKPLAALSEAVAALQRVELSDEQRSSVNSLVASLQKLQAAAAPLPAARKRR
jgi:hypothetical protein